MLKKWLPPQGRLIWGRKEHANNTSHIREEKGKWAPAPVLFVK